jgi:hypothetical protein
MPKNRNQEIVSAAAAAPTGIALSQTLGGAGPVTLNGALVTGGVATLPAAQPITITSAGNDSGITFKITGTDYGGSPVSETLAGANAAAATSVQQYSMVTSIVASAATAAAITVGTAAAQYGPWLIVGAQRNEFQTNVRCFLASGGTANYDLQATSDIQIMNQVGGYADDIDTLLAAQTGNVSSFPNAPWMAYRLKVNSGGPVTLRILENRTA